MEPPASYKSYPAIKVDTVSDNDFSTEHQRLPPRSAGNTPTPEKKLFNELSRATNRQGDGYSGSEASSLSPTSPVMMHEIGVSSAEPSSSRARASKTKKKETKPKRKRRASSTCDEDYEAVASIALAESYFNVTCGYERKLHGKLYPEKFGSGGRGRCIFIKSGQIFPKSGEKVEVDQFVTPAHFEKLGGMASSKCYIKSIKFCHRPIKDLVTNGFLQTPHATSCKCVVCSEGRSHNQIKVQIDSNENTKESIEEKGSGAASSPKRKRPRVSKHPPPIVTSSPVKNESVSAESIISGPVTAPAPVLHGQQMAQNAIQIRREEIRGSTDSPPNPPDDPSPSMSSSTTYHTNFSNFPNRPVLPPCTMPTFKPPANQRPAFMPTFKPPANHRPAFMPTFKPTNHQPTFKPTNQRPTQEKISPGSKISAQLSSLSKFGLVKPAGKPSYAPVMLRDQMYIISKSHDRQDPTNSQSSGPLIVLSRDQLPTNSQSSRPQIVLPPDQLGHAPREGLLKIMTSRDQQDPAPPLSSDQGVASLSDHASPVQGILQMTSRDQQDHAPPIPIGQGMTSPVLQEHATSVPIVEGMTSPMHRDSAHQTSCELTRPIILVRSRDGSLPFPMESGDEEKIETKAGDFSRNKACLFEVNCEPSTEQPRHVISVPVLTNERPEGLLARQQQVDQPEISIPTAVFPQKSAKGCNKFCVDPNIESSCSSMDITLSQNEQVLQTTVLPGRSTTVIQSSPIPHKKDDAISRKRAVLYKLGLEFDDAQLKTCGKDIFSQDDSLHFGFNDSVQDFKKVRNTADLGVTKDIILQSTIDGHGTTAVTCRELADFGLDQCQECVSESGGWCRFADFRVLNVTRDNGIGLSAAGFLSSDGVDLSVWLPPSTSKMTSCTAGYIVQNLVQTLTGMLRCEEESKDMIEANESVGRSVQCAFRKVDKIRELCDVCHTTIFNLHHFCPHCGFAVCHECVAARNRGLTREDAQGAFAETRDRYGWVYCTMEDNEDDKMVHYPRLMSIATLVPDKFDKMLSTVNSVRKELDSLIKEKHISINCSCEEEKSGGFHKCYCAKEKDIEGEPEPEAIYLCDGKLLVLKKDTRANLIPFQKHWSQSKPVIIANCHEKLKADEWKPEFFKITIPDTEILEKVVVDCRVNKPVGKTNQNPTGVSLHQFWDGFIDDAAKPKDARRDSMCLKLKDYPAHKTFKEALPEHYKAFCEALPLPQYTSPEADGLHQRGCYNLATKLPDHYVKPDLGPKMYNAYGMLWNSTLATTNLHLDISDACNVMVNVTVPMIRGETRDDYYRSAMSTVLVQEGFQKDSEDYTRVMDNWQKAGAIWTIFKPEDNEAIRQFLANLHTQSDLTIQTDTGEFTTVEVSSLLDKESASCNDPIHDQRIFMTGPLRQLLKKQTGVEGATFVQMLGDAVFIPAGAAHQVQNLLNCIKIAEDFVSPEGVTQSAIITDEFRDLTVKHQNREDKLQLVNIVYHSICEAITSLKQEKETNES